MPTTATVFDSVAEPMVSALDRKGLTAEARTLLLLRICQLGQLAHAESLPKYWQLLRVAGTHLTPDDRDTAVRLRSTIEPGAAPAGHVSAFARRIIARLEAGMKVSRSNPALARKVLVECEQRLNDRTWPFGKVPAWAAIAEAWAGVDRKEALRLLGRLRRDHRVHLLETLHAQRALTAEEWETAHGAGAAVEQVLDRILDADRPALTLGTARTREQAKRLLAAAFPYGSIEKASQDVRTRHEKSIERYVKLARALYDSDPDAASALVEELLARATTTEWYAESWTDRFGVIRQLLNAWGTVASSPERTLGYLAKHMPGHLREFAIAQWLGAVPKSAEEVASAYRRMIELVGANANAEAWFLVTVVRRGSGSAALALARSSPRAASLVPRVARAWLLNEPDAAGAALTRDDAPRDIIAEFLLARGAEVRVRWLRDRTHNGDGRLPSEMWEEADVLELVRHTMLADGGQAFVQQAYPPFVSRNQSPETQFDTYLRVHGCGQYTWEEVDQALLPALVAWDDAHPREVEGLLERMWRDLRPTSLLIKLDLLRNAVFDRCITLFAAHPESLDAHFISWIKRDLVDQGMSETVGNTTTTTRLNPIAPFLQSLLAAQKVAKVSAKRCDEILRRAIRAYPANEQLMRAAAELYASDKGMSALDPPCPLADGTNIKAWQMGVVDAAWKRAALMVAISG
jgi:hypothetical protein